MSIASAISERKEKSDALRRAVLSGTSDEVTRVLIKGGMEPEGLGLWGVSPLFHAAEYGRNVVVGLLLASGADVDRRCGRLHATALHVAAECGHVEVVLRLLAAGADPTKINRDYQTPLHAAVFSGSVKVVARLLDAGANLNARNLHGDTPLSLAVAHDDVDVVTLLLFAGADPSAEGIDGYSPLHEAAEAGKVETLVELLIAGAHPSLRHPNTGETPLFLAAGEGLAGVVGILIRWGADATVQTFEGLTPLDIAAKNGHVAVMRELFHHGEMESVTGRELAYNPPAIAGARAPEVEGSLLKPGMRPRQPSLRNGDELSRRSALVAMPLEEESRGSHIEFTRQPRGAKCMALEGGYQSSVTGDDRSSLNFSSEDTSTSGDVYGCSERGDREQRRMLEGRTVWPLRSPAKSRPVMKAGRLQTLDCELRACVRESVAVQPFSDGGAPSINSLEGAGNNFLGCWKSPVWERTAAVPAATGAILISDPTTNRGECVGNDWKAPMRQNLARELPHTLEKATDRPKARAAARPADREMYAVEYHDSVAPSRAGGSLFSSVGGSQDDLSQSGSSHAPDPCRRVRFCINKEFVLDDTVDASSCDEGIVQGLGSGGFAVTPMHGLWPMSPAELGDEEVVPREYSVDNEMEMCSSEDLSKASDQPCAMRNGAQSGAGVPKCVDVGQRNDDKRRRGLARLVTLFSGGSTTTLKQESSIDRGTSKSAVPVKCSQEPTSTYRGRLPGYKTFSSLLRLKGAVH